MHCGTYVFLLVVRSLMFGSYSWPVQHYTVHYRHLGLIPFDLRRDLWHQKIIECGLSCDIVCVIRSLAILIKYRHVTDRHMTTAYTALHDNEIYATIKWMLQLMLFYCGIYIILFYMCRWLKGYLSLHGKKDMLYKSNNKFSESFLVWMWWCCYRASYRHNLTKRWLASWFVLKMAI